MTIPTIYLWPLGCLTAIGAVHAAFAIEEMVLTVVRAIIKGSATWR